MYLSDYWPSINPLYHVYFVDSDEFSDPDDPVDPIASYMILIAHASLESRTQARIFH